MRDFKGKTVFVTGSSGDLGLSIVKAFASVGANVWAHSRKSESSSVYNEAIAAIREKSEGWIREVHFDLADTSAIKEGARDVVSTREPLDILVNNAGMPCQNTLLRTSVSAMRQVMDVNFIAPSYLIQLFSRLMIRSGGGSIVNVASRSGLEPRDGVYAYGASKAALCWASRALARELAPYNIRVNAVAPGLIDTRMGARSRSEEDVDKYVAVNCIKRPAECNEIVEAIMFLSSEQSSYITGQVISVDGGRW